MENQQSNKNEFVSNAKEAALHIGILFIIVSISFLIFKPFLVPVVWGCVKHCLNDISYNFSPMAFEFSDMMTMDKTLNWLPFCDLGSIFKVTRGHLVSKLTCLCDIFCGFGHVYNHFQIKTLHKDRQDL